MLRHIILLLTLLLFSCMPAKTIQSDGSKSYNPLSALIAIHEGPLDHLNAVRRGECPMHPSCSAYGKAAYEKHGFFIGWVMTMDRLIRCGRDELKHSPSVLIDGRWKCNDPVEGNDFWWNKR